MSLTLGISKPPWCSGPNVTSRRVQLSCSDVSFRLKGGSACCRPCENHTFLKKKPKSFIVKGRLRGTEGLIFLTDSYFVSFGSIPFFGANDAIFYPSQLFPRLIL